MRIALSSDEIYPINYFVLDLLKDFGHEVLLFGALASKKNESWVKTAKEAVNSMVLGQVDEAILFCWTGTGVAIAANRHPEIRAALCVDAETARAARIWNHANILVLSNRMLSQDIAREIIKAWFEDYDRDKGMNYVMEL